MRLLGVFKASILLDIQHRTLGDWTNPNSRRYDRTFPVHNVSGMKVFVQEEVEQWIQNNNWKR